MGKVQFTTEQEIILDEVKRSEFLHSRFYFTGGTALNYLYLHHRLSDDLDFFSKDALDQQVILSLMQQWSQKHNFVFQSRFVDVVYIFTLTFASGSNLKVDFATYPYTRLGKETFLDGLSVDSVQDIAVNKLLMISQRSEVKDFVDLYFLLQAFTIWDLITGVKTKFHVDIEPFLLAADFLKVEDFDYLPKMIKPITLAQLQTFFRDKAKEIGSKGLA